MVDETARRVAAALAARGETLAVAESATGGLILSLLTDVPGASAWLHGGLVAYTNSVKIAILRVPPETLSAHGSVSAETALAMAHGAQRLFGATWAVGETGIAGPQTGRRSAKPAGLTYIAVVGAHTPSGVTGGVGADSVVHDPANAYPSHGADLGADLGADPGAHGPSGPRPEAPSNARTHSAVERVERILLPNPDDRVATKRAFAAAALALLLDALPHS